MLTDIRMPSSTASALLRAVRELAPDVIVLMMTAHWTRDSDEWARRWLGAEALFEKPFRDVNLVTLQVRQLLESRRAASRRTRVLRQAARRARVLPASSAAAGRCSTCSGWSRRCAAPTARC